MSLTIHIKDVGDLKVELFCKETPLTSKNFLALAAKGYYDGTKFHRNIKGFIIQGGDPTNTGKGGESIYGKHFADEIHAELKHDRRGILSMANGGPNTNGSQFFILYSKQTSLDGKSTVFGKVIDGFDTLDKLEKEPVGKANRPLNDLIIEEITIHSNPIALEETEKENES